MWGTSLREELSIPDQLNKKTKRPKTKIMILNQIKLHCLTTTTAAQEVFTLISHYLRIELHDRVNVSVQFARKTRMFIKNEDIRRLPVCIEIHLSFRVFLIKYGATIMTKRNRQAIWNVRSYLQTASLSGWIYDKL